MDGRTGFGKNDKNTKLIKRYKGHEEKEGHESPRPEGTYHIKEGSNTQDILNAREGQRGVTVIKILKKRGNCRNMIDHVMRVTVYKSDITSINNL